MHSRLSLFTSRICEQSPASQYDPCLHTHKDRENRWPRLLCRNRKYPAFCVCLVCKNGIFLHGNETINDHFSWLDLTKHVWCWYIAILGFNSRSMIPNYWLIFGDKKKKKHPLFSGRTFFIWPIWLMTDFSFLFYTRNLFKQTLFIVLHYDYNLHLAVSIHIQTQL